MKSTASTSQRVTVPAQAARNARRALNGLDDVDAMRANPASEDHRKQLLQLATMWGEAKRADRIKDSAPVDAIEAAILDLAEALDADADAIEAEWSAEPKATEEETVNDQPPENLLDADYYLAFTERVYEGDVNPQEVVDTVDALVAHEDAVKASIAEHTIKEIRKKFSGRGSGRKKAEVVDQAYHGLLESCVPTFSYSYNPFTESLAASIQNVAEQVDEDQIQDYAKEVAERRAAARERYEEKVEAVQDPQTLDDYETFVRVRGADELTDRQRLTFDALRFEDRLERRRSGIKKRTAADVDGVEFTIVEAYHEKRDIPLWVVQLSERIEKSQFTRLKRAAKNLGGWYSSYSRGRAKPGFQFESSDEAEAFVAAQTGDDVSEAVFEWRRKQIANAENIREVAERTYSDADERLNQDRKTNTRRRMRIARGIESEERERLQLADTMLNVADALEAGDIKFLGALRHRTEFKQLESRLSLAHWNYAREKSEEGGRAGPAAHEIVEREPIDELPPAKLLSYVKYPGITLNRYTVQKLVEKAEGVKGAKAIAKFWKRRLSGQKMDMEFGERATGYAKKKYLELYERTKDNAGLSSNFELRGLDSYRRMKRIDIQSVSELRAALHEYMEYRGERRDADKLEEAIRDLKNGGKIDGFFPTPAGVIDDMLAEAEIESGMKVLEPSAGKGDIADAIRSAHPDADLTVIEQMHSLAKILEMKGYEDLLWDDFLEHEETYDRILMNPPFEKKQDIDHVRHAYSLLKPGGRVVSVMGEGAFFRSAKKDKQFRAWLSERGESWALPDGTFEGGDYSTSVSTRLVMLKKVEEEQDASDEKEPERDASTSTETTQSGPNPYEKQRWRDAWEKGRTDRQRGVDIDRGPFAESDGRNDAWQRGWSYADGLASSGTPEIPPHVVQWANEEDATHYDPDQLRQDAGATKAMLYGPSSQGDGLVKQRFTRWDADTVPLNSGTWTLNATITQDDLDDRYERIPGVESSKTSQSSAPTDEQAATSAASSIEVKDVPLSLIETDEARFQPRGGAYSEETARKIATDFDPALMKPIDLWQDPEDGNLYVLAGHSRLEGFKRRGADAIPAVVKDMTEQEAIRYALIENDSGTNLSNVERAAVVRRLRESGELDTMKEQREFAEEMYDRNASVVFDLSWLDPKGKATDVLQSFSSASEDQKRVESMAQWVGKLMRLHRDDFTRSHENELFNFLQDNFRSKGRKFSAFPDFKKYVEDAKARVGFMGSFDSSKPLNLSNVQPKTQQEQRIDEEVQRKKEALREARKELETTRETLAGRAADGESVTESDYERILKPLDAAVTRAQQDLLQAKREAQGARQTVRQSQTALFGRENPSEPAQLVYIGMATSLTTPAGKRFEGEAAMFMPETMDALILVPHDYVTVTGTGSTKNEAFQTWHSYKPRGIAFNVDVPTSNPVDAGYPVRIEYASDKIIENGDRMGKVNGYYHDFDPEHTVVRTGDPGSHALFIGCTVKDGTIYNEHTLDIDGRGILN